jgi:hypothetical protein
MPPLLPPTRRSLKAPLLGVPITVKEQFGVAGLPTTWGNPKFKDWRPEVDALAVQRLRLAKLEVRVVRENPRLPDLAQTLSAALIQMGRAAGFEVWVTTRNDEGATIAERLGANRIFRHGEQLPRRVDAVVDNIGAVTWSDSLKAVKRGGVLVINGVTTGHAAQTDLLRIFVEQIDIRGTIMGTLEEMKAMMQFISATTLSRRSAPLCR